MLNYVMIALALGSVYALIAVGFALIYGILNFSNFSHGVVMAVGAFFGYFAVTKYHVPWVLALLGSMVVCAVLGVVIEFLALRKLRISNAPKIYMFVSSITVLLIIQNILTLMYQGNLYNYPTVLPIRTIRIFGSPVSTTYMLMFFICIIVLVLLNLFLRKTRMGIAISAAASDLKTTSLMGVNVNLIITAVFLIAGAIGGMTGVFLGMSYTVNAQMGQMVLKGFIATVIGGMGSLSGAVLGAFILGILEVVFTLTIGSGLSAVGQFVIVILFLLIRPQGLMGRKNIDKV